jgi:hypothetical protein
MQKIVKKYKNTKIEVILFFALLSLIEGEKGCNAFLSELQIRIIIRENSNERTI